MVRLTSLLLPALLLILSFSSTPSLAATESTESESLGKYTVQVAAFDVESRAKVFTSDLKTRGFRAFYFPVTLKGRPWFRVGIGLFATESEAKHYRSEVLSKTKLPEAIIRAVE